MHEDDDDEALRYGREDGNRKTIEMEIPGADLDFFARGYLNPGQPLDNFHTWLGCFDNALDIEADGHAFYDDYKLTAQQMGEGARIRARAFAMMIALRPADTFAELGFKVFMEMILAMEKTEWRRSHVMGMLRAAIDADQRSLGVLVCPYSLTQH